MTLAELVELDEGWQSRALCKGATSLFFPGRGEDTSAAKAICEPCPVRERCLEHALTYPEKIGIYGGYTEKERRLMRRQRREDAA